ncbi:MAG: hypothetical protein NUW37_08675 [Planctomycetes bacterium]|nr:hypothetical protein [Planctomycetota bacterium]
MIIDNKKTFSAIDDTHAEIEFNSIDPLNPNLLPIDYEAEFLFKPDRAGIDVEYHIIVKTPEPDITITQDKENICVNEEVVFTASFDDPEIDIDNLGFALYYIENGNPVEIPPPGDARAQLVSLTEDAESKTVTIEFGEPGQFELYAFYGAIDPARLGDFEKATVKVFRIQSAAGTITMDYGEPIDPPILVDISGPAGDLAGVNVTMTQIDGPEIFEGAFPSVHALAGIQNFPGFSTGTATFTPKFRVLEDIADINANATFRFTFAEADCFHEIVFVPDPSKFPPNPPNNVESILLNSIIFDWDKEKSDRDAIGIRRTCGLNREWNELVPGRTIRHTSNERMNDIPDTVEHPGWTPANEDNGIHNPESAGIEYRFQQVNGKAIFDFDRNFDFDIVPNSGNNVVTSHSYQVRFNDSPILFKMGVDRPVIAAKFYLSQELRDRLDDQLQEQDDRVNVTVWTEGGDLISIPRTQVSFGRGGVSKDSSFQVSPFRLRNDDYVPLPIEFSSDLNDIVKSTEKLEWFFEITVNGNTFTDQRVQMEVNPDERGRTGHLPSESSISVREATTKHSVYVIFDEPVSPWIPKINRAQQSDYNELKNEEGSKVWTQMFDELDNVFLDIQELQGTSSTDIEAVKKGICIRLEEYLHNFDIRANNLGANLKYSPFTPNTLNYYTRFWDSNTNYRMSLVGWKNNHYGVDNLVDVLLTDQLWGLTLRNADFFHFDFSAAFMIIARALGVDIDMILANPFAGYDEDTGGSYRRDYNITGTAIVPNSNPATRVTTTDPFYGYSYVAFGDTGRGTLSNQQALIKDGSIFDPLTAVQYANGFRLASGRFIYNNDPNVANIIDTLTVEEQFWMSHLKETDIRGDFTGDRDFRRALQGILRNISDSDNRRYIDEFRLTTNIIRR